MALSAVTSSLRAKEPSGVTYATAFEELLVADRVGWSTYHAAPLDEREAMIATFQARNELDAAVADKAEREADLKARTQKAQG